MNIPICGNPRKYKKPFSCRCGKCVRAHNRQNLKVRASLAGKEPKKHGTFYAASVYKCQCEICVGVKKSKTSEYSRKWRSAFKRDNDPKRYSRVMRRGHNTQVAILMSVDSKGFCQLSAPLGGVSIWHKSLLRFASPRKRSEDLTSEE